MKNRKLLITLTVTAMAAVSVMGETLLSPRAAGNKTKTVRGYNEDPNIATPGLTAVTPRVQDNQSKTVPGKSSTETPTVKSTRRVAVSPKMAGSCAQNSGDASCCAPATEKK